MLCLIPCKETISKGTGCSAKPWGWSQPTQQQLHGTGGTGTEVMAVLLSAAHVCSSDGSNTRMLQCW